MFDYIRVCTAVPEVSVGNTDFNTEKIMEMINKTKEQNPDIIILPELCVTGYTCADLFFQDTLLNGSKAAVKAILKECSDLNCIVALGAPVNISNQLYNCALIIFKGEILGIVPKTFIPDYGEFYEKRWFSSASELSFDEISSYELGLDEEYFIPIGNDLIFDTGNVKIGAEICEDLWSPLPPSTHLAIDGAELIINLSASNEIISKREYRRSLVSQQSARLMCAYAYASAGSSESTTDLIFSGHSVIAENGTILAENKNYIDDNYILTTDIDIGKIRSERRKLKSFKDSGFLYGSKSRIVSIKLDESKSMGELYKVEKLPFIPSQKEKRLERSMNIFKMQVSALKKRLEVTGAVPVVGISGGLDSTLALLVCAQTMKELNRSASEIVGVTMPGFGTTDRTYTNSLTLMKTLGVTTREISIKDACIAHFKDIGHDINDHSVTYENAQARERTQVLMDVANSINGIVIGTGDLSELALGWCTYNADHMSMYGVNAGVPKTLVRWLIDSVTENNVFPESCAVLRDILDTPISPELLPPDEKGNIAQKTEDLVGPYALHDFFMYYVLRFGFEPEKIYHLAKKAFKDDFDNAQILKWLKTFYRRFFTQQFKRSCLPDGVKVGSVCLSPRGDWRMPSDASSALWLKKVDELN